MSLFDEHHTLRAVIDCALERRFGNVAFDDPGRPVLGRIDLGCYAIFSGDANHPLAAAWVSALKPPLEILLPDDQAWRDLLDRLLGDRCSDRTMRTFALHALDRDELRSVGIADGFRVEALDADLVRRFNDDLRPHALDVFAGPEALVEQGLGFVAISPDGQVAAQTTSYAISSASVEIAIGTHPDFRRRGLARSIAAPMMLACLDRGLRPEWSAANPVSKRLARSLGYRPAALCDIVYFE